MIAGLANIMADFFVEKHLADAKEHEIYRYGCEVILSTAVNVLIVILCGLLFNEMSCVAVFYAVFLLLRRYCGGYHADTYLRCNIIFTLTILMVVLILKNCDLLAKSFLFIVIVTSLSVIYRLSPVINKNKPLTEGEAVRYRRISLKIAVSAGMCAALLIFFDKKASVTVSLALLSVSGAMVIEIIKRRYGGEKHEG